MIIVKSNKEYFDRTGWRCAIDDILDFYFPTLKNVELVFNFIWGRCDENHRWSGFHQPKPDKSHHIDVLINSHNFDNYDAIKTLLHELRHVEQHRNGATAGTSGYTGDAYYYHPKEIDARKFEENADEAYSLVKEYLQ